MYIPRELDTSVVSSLNNNKVLIVLGARQVGKTTLLKKVISERKGILLNLDIEVDRAKFISASKLSPDEAMKYLSSNDIIVIDEAHKEESVGRIVKGWYDFGVKPKIILSGSSSINLLDRFAENLTGRNEKLYLTPLLFSESLKTQNWYNHNLDIETIKKDFPEQNISFLNKLLIYGSYPESLTSLDPIKYLQNLTSDYLLRDTIQDGLIKSEANIKKLLLMLAYQIGSEVSTSELSRNLGVSRQTIDKYLSILEKVYLIFRLPAFSRNPRKEINKSQKIYFWDIGVRNALINDFNLIDFRIDTGALWENFVISEFAKRNLTFGNLNNLYFWRQRDGGEVDLIVKTPIDLKAYEIKWQKNNQKIPKGFINDYPNIEVKLINRGNYMDFLVNS